MSDASNGRRRVASSAMFCASKYFVNSLMRLTVSIVLLPPMSMTVMAAPNTFLMSAGLGVQVPPTLGSVPVDGAHLPPFVPHCTFVVQVVLQVPATTPVHDPAAIPGQSASALHEVVVPVHVPATTPPHDPTPAPGQVASALQLSAAGPLNIVFGGFGDAQTELT